MEVQDTGIEDLKLIQPKVHGDHRGYFVETHNQQNFADAGLNFNFVQDNQSKSKQYTFRGLHFQQAPKAQTKLVRCLEGEILDIAIDLRPDSATYKKNYSVVLSDENFLQLLVPKGFAHGFLVLSESATVAYKCDEFYAPELELGLRHDDELVTLKWPVDPKKFLFSERDQKWPKFM